LQTVSDDFASVHEAQLLVHRRRAFCFCCRLLLQQLVLQLLLLQLLLLHLLLLHLLLLHLLHHVWLEDPQVVDDFFSHECAQRRREHGKVILSRHG